MSLPSFDYHKSNILLFRCPRVDCYSDHHLNNEYTLVLLLNGSIIQVTLIQIPTVRDTRILETSAYLTFRFFNALTILKTSYDIQTLQYTVGIWITNMWTGETFTCWLFRCPVIVCYSRHDLNTELVCYSDPHCICNGFDVQTGPLACLSQSSVM